MPFRVFLADSVGEAWYDMDWPELPEVGALRQTRLREGALVFDLGAHQCVVAMMLAAEVGTTGQVLAIEPGEHNCRVAFKNRELNGLNQLQILKCAVTDFNGVIDFSDAKGRLDDGTGAWGRQAIAATTIDRLAETYGFPSIVFIDIEGAECLALAGATKVLAAGAEFVVEVHVGCGLEKLGGSVQQVLSYFPPDRFRIRGRTDEERVFQPFAESDPITHGRFFLLAETIGNNDCSVLPAGRCGPS
jgi:FkbM family methyltransferase